ncbi:flavodoxin family protein [Methanoregula sp.]|uniref:flavodoxin family protein n=3 Tax=Methanoregula sp. TaxID=2052170 RepID=UPI003C795851
MLKIIGILGSPLPDGNTALLLDKALEGAKAAGCEVELIDVITLDIQSCQEIYYCKDHNTCILNDDMIPIYPKVAALDSLILATPIMTMGIPGHLKSFIDRFQVFYMAKYFRNEPLVSPDLKKRRKSLFISISGMDIPGVFNGAKQTIKAFFDIIDSPYHDELLISGMDQIKDITTRPDLLNNAYAKGFALGASLMESRQPD